MGFFHSIYFKNSKGEDCEIQFKNAGEFDPQSFEIGDKITTPDGIHFDQGGCFVVWEGKIVAAFDKEDNPLLTKWGGALRFPNLEDHNPLLIAAKKYKENNSPKT